MPNFMCAKKCRGKGRSRHKGRAEARARSNRGEHLIRFDRGRPRAGVLWGRGGTPELHQEEKEDDEEIEVRAEGKVIYLEGARGGEEQVGISLE